MKAFGLPVIAALLFVFTAVNGQGQTARQLTRKIVPPANQPPAPPPAMRPAPAAPAQPAQPAVAPAPVDPAGEKAKQAETLKRSIEFQKKRAEDGSASAQYEMGVHYLKGEGVEKDLEAARKWFEKSAAQDFSLAKRKLEEMDAGKKP